MKEVLVVTEYRLLLVAWLVSSWVLTTCLLGHFSLLNTFVHRHDRCQKGIFALIGAEYKEAAVMAAGFCVVEHREGVDAC